MRVRKNYIISKIDNFKKEKEYQTLKFAMYLCEIISREVFETSTRARFGFQPNVFALSSAQPSFDDDSVSTARSVSRPFRNSIKPPSSFFSAKSI